MSESEQFTFRFEQDELQDTFYDNCISVTVTVSIHPTLVLEYEKIFDDRPSARSVAEWLTDVMVIQDSVPDGINAELLRKYFTVVKVKTKEY